MDTKIDGLVWSSPVYGLLVDLYIVEVAKLKFGACNSSLWANMMAMISWISGPEDRLLWVEPLWIGPPLCNFVIKCNQGYSLSNTHNIWRLLTRRMPLCCEHNLETHISYIYIIYIYMMMMRVNFQGACVLNCMQISTTRVISMASVLPSPSLPVRLKEANQTYIIYPLWISLSKPTTYFTKTIPNLNLADSVDAMDATSFNQWTILPGGLWPILMETSYYVGAEPKNAVQSEKFWRNRIDAEEVLATGSLQLLRGDGLLRSQRNMIGPEKTA